MDTPVDALARTLVHRAKREEEAGDLATARVTVDVALALLVGLDAPSLTAVALTRRAGLHRAAWRHAQARADVARALELMPAGDPQRSAVLVEAGRQAHDLSCFAEAHEWMSEAVAAATDKGQLALALDGLGLVERDSGRYADATQTLTRALELARKAFGERSLPVVMVLSDLGITGKYAGRFEDAEQCYARALAVLVGLVGEEHPDVSALHHSIGGLAHARGHLLRAEEHARRSVAVRQQVDPHDPVIALDKGALAAILASSGQAAEAESLLREVIPALESLGEANRELAVSLNNLAALRFRAGDRNEAAELWQRSLAAKETVLGPDAPELAATLNNIAVALKADGAVAAAVAHYERAVAILEAGVEPDHPTLARTRRNLAAAEALLAVAA